MRPPTVLNRPCVVELAGPHGSTATDVELRYDSRDPYAVSLAFMASEPEVVWVFARDLLLEGVSEPAGHGDVLVSPSLDADGRATVLLALRSPEGHAMVKAPARDVIAFLGRTAQAVWPGTEAEHLSADEAIAAILVSDYS